MSDSSSELSAGDVNGLTVERGAFAEGGREHLVAQGIVDDAGDHLAVFMGGKAGRTLLAAEDDAEHGKAVREVGGAVERVDVPAELAVEAFAGSLFAVDAVVGKRRAEALRR